MDMDIDAFKMKLKDAVTKIKDKNVDHPAYAQQSEPFAQLVRNTFK